MATPEQPADGIPLNPSVARPRAKPVAPAVARAVRIIGYLAETEDGASVSDIARALDINKSTCFTILSTLVDNQVISKHPRFHIYRLGPRLVEWGRKSRTQFAVRTGLRDAIGEFVADLSVTCLVGQRLADNRGVVVIDRIVPNRPGTLTPQIGEVYPLSNPAIGRLILSTYEDETEAVATALRVGLLRKGDKIDGFRAELARTRERGYAIGREDRTDVNAVAAPLSPAAAELLSLLCVIGYGRDLPVKELDAVGLRLVEFADHLLSRPGTSEAFIRWPIGGWPGDREPVS
jgi:IclR family acetate operon transcriptional repressor